MRTRARDSRPNDPDRDAADQAAGEGAGATPSKSQRKRDMLALQVIGESLLPLADDRLQRLPISPELIDAVRLAREIRAHEGRRRQMQLIGRLMRDIDADALRAALADETREHRVATAVMHAAERWRERMLADDQVLEQLVRAVSRDARDDRTAGATRARANWRRAAPGARIGSCSASCATGSADSPTPGPESTATMTDATRPIRIGLVSISDRASQGVYQDQGIPGLQEWLASALRSPWQAVLRLIPDERSDIERTLIELVDREGCSLVLTTGGTGPAPRDVTPDATLAVGDREMPGFGEQMRQISLNFVPTAILSRQVAVIRGQALIVNLPGQPKSIRETLEGVRDADGRQKVHGIFAAVPYCLDLIGAPYIETHDAVCKAFRPKSAQRNAGS